MTPKTMFVNRREFLALAGAACFNIGNAQYESRELEQDGSHKNDECNHEEHSYEHCQMAMTNGLKQHAGKSCQSTQGEFPGPQSPPMSWLTDDGGLFMLLQRGNAACKGKENGHEHKANKTSQPDEPFCSCWAMAHQ